MGFKVSVATSAGATGFGPLMFVDNVAGAVRAAAELGYDGVEISMKNPAELPQPELKRLLDKYGLRLAAVASGRIFLDEKATLSDPDKSDRSRVIARVNELVSYAGEFGALVIVGLLRGQWPVDGDMEGSLDRFEESMRVIADHAAANGTVVVLEAINRYETVLLNTAEQTVEAVKKIGRPNVKVLLDVFHMNIEEVSIGDAIRATGDLLGHFHIADSNRRAPGMGHVVYQDIAKALHDIGYEGWVSAEHLPLPDDLTAAKQTRMFTRSL